MKENLYIVVWNSPWCSREKISHALIEGFFKANSDDIKNLKDKLMYVKKGNNEILGILSDAIPVMDSLTLKEKEKLEKAPCLLEHIEFVSSECNKRTKYPNWNLEKGVCNNCLQSDTEDSNLSSF